MMKTKCLNDRLSQPYTEAERSPAPPSRLGDGDAFGPGASPARPYITRKIFAAGEEVANQRYRGKQAEAWKTAMRRA
jgi:hypothetical protein